MRPLIWYAALAAGIALLVVGLSWFFGTNWLLNRFYKPKLEAAFGAAHPGCALRIGQLTYLPWHNCVLGNAIELRNSNAVWTCQAGAVTLHGLRWAELFRRKDTARQFLARSEITATNLVFEFPKPQYRLRCLNVRASLPKSTLVADEFDLRPMVNDEEFFTAREFRRTRFQFHVPHCEVSGANGAEWLQGNGFHAQSIVLQSPLLETLADRQKPVNPHPAPPVMPQEALARLKQPLRVDKLTALDGRVAMGLRVDRSLEPGVLTFDSVQLTAERLTNDPGTNGPIQIRGEAKLMNAGLLKIALQIPRAASELTFPYSGSLGAMDLTLISPYLEVAGNMRIKSGQLREASFQSEVHAGHAVGEFKGLYEGLEMSFLDKKTGKASGVVNRVKSMVTDRWILRTENLPDKTGFAAIGRIDYTRKPEEKYLHFLWFGIRSGMIDLLGISDYAKMPH